MGKLPPLHYHSISCLCDKCLKVDSRIPFFTINSYNLIQVVFDTEPDA